MLKNSKELRITDALYIGIVSALSAVCYRLFYLMSIEPNGRYISDIAYYVNLPTADNKELYKLTNLSFTIVHKLLPNHSHGGMVLLMALCVAMIVFTNYAYIHYFTKDNGASRIQEQIASLLGPFLGTMYIPGMHEFFYRNSFASFSWQSPTEHCMIVFSTLALLFFIKMYEESDAGVNRKYWILTTVTAALSAYSKPPFVLNLTAAMIAAFLIELAASPSEKRKTKFKNMVIMGSSLIPAGCFVILIVKSTFLGADHSHRAGIAITFENLLSTENLFITVIAGLAFPIIVWAANYRVIKSKKYCIPFGIFVMGILQWAPFRETGARAEHGNFEWGREIGCYYLFLTSLALALNNWNDKEFLKGRPTIRKIYFVGLGLLLIWHVGSQMVYFYLINTGEHFYQ